MIRPYFGLDTVKNTQSTRNIRCKQPLALHFLPLTCIRHRSALLSKHPSSRRKESK
jgi:hypothetical protein